MKYMQRLAATFYITGANEAPSAKCIDYIDAIAIGRTVFIIPREARARLLNVTLNFPRGSRSDKLNGEIAPTDVPAVGLSARADNRGLALCISRRSHNSSSCRSEASFSFRFPALSRDAPFGIKGLRARARAARRYRLPVLASASARMRLSE